jgi:hypothetical protein
VRFDVDRGFGAGGVLIAHSLSRPLARVRRMDGCQ